MRREALAIAVAVLLAGCGAKAPPEMVQHYTGRTLYTCCNIHYSDEVINDANYSDGKIVPLGSPVRIVEVMPDAITFEAAGTTLTVQQVYGKGKETPQQYFDKLFVEKNPAERVAPMPAAVQKAVKEGRVERGMTRQEVVLALGYPPIDDNPTPSSPDWKMWHSKGKSYTVKFIGKYVDEVVGNPAPTTGKPVRKLVVR